MTKQTQEQRRFEEAAAYLYEVPRFTEKNPLAHTQELMHRLGDVQDSFHTIHVAGSNGKGSVCACFDSMLRAAGRKTGLFTSPHLTDIRERFLIDGQMCTRETFLKAYDTVMDVVRQMQRDGFKHPTFFELVYAIGMLIFAQAGVGYLVLETGLGGRLDATNLVKRPLLTIITSVSLEHTQYLGGTIEEIAFEKAGILKEGVPLVCDGDNEKALAVIRKRARRLHCKTITISSKMCHLSKITSDGIDFLLCNSYDKYKAQSWSIPFYAPYQMVNAALAITGFRELFGTSDEADAQIRKGLADTRWPGRMQEVLPEVYVDGGHNEAGMDAFVRAVQLLCKEDPYPPMLLFSMASDKDHEAAARILSGKVRWASVTVVPMQSKRGQDVSVLADAFACCGCSVVNKGTAAADTFDLLRKEKKEGQKLFVCGSFYLIGELFAHLKGEEHDRL